MTLSPQTVVFVAIMILIVGFAAGWLAGGARGGGENKSEDAPPGGRKGAYIELIRLWREKAGTRMVVEFEDKAFLTREPLQPAQLQRLRRLVADLSSWAGVSAIVADTPPVLQTPVTDMPKPNEPVVAPPKPESTAEPIAAGAWQAGIPVLQAGAPAVEKPMSITEQIDQILQDMLTGTALEERRIRLVENPRSGVVVWVGKETFDGIGAVPYPEVTEAIRKAVREWEKRAG